MSFHNSYLSTCILSFSREECFCSKFASLTYGSSHLSCIIYLFVFYQIRTHIQNCKSCPEPIKASITYLEHRKSLQKKEIGPTRKKEFYERIFDRLHNVQRGCKKARGSSIENIPRKIKGNFYGNGSDNESDSGNERVFDDEYVEREMGDMIHRAAAWLTALDNARASGGRGGRGGRGHSVRSLPSSGRGSGLPKRARLGL